MVWYRVRGILLVASMALGAGGVAAQTDGAQGPVPAPVVAPRYFRNAVERGWRTDDGHPGASYWTNWAHYDLTARLDPATARLEGTGRVTYYNRSPAALRVIQVHLYQNLHKEGVPRNSSQEVTGGVELDRVAVGGLELEEAPLRTGPAYEVNGTIMNIRPAEAVEPGDSITLEFAWASTLPQNGSGRMGYSEKEVYLVGYWFPKVAVFDDLRGWDAEPYLSNAEFYDEFGDYDVSLTVPAGWTVMATGDLENGDEVYSPQTLERLALARTSDDRVEVASPADLRAGRVTTAGTGGWLTYRFEADSVRDFTWTTSNVQRWDATSALVPDRDGDGVEDRVLINSFWREDRAPLWEDQWRYGKESIEHHSRYTGLVYPWPHMTSVEGDDIIGGGMEFPMLTLIGGYRDAEPQDLFNVTSHELGHMWIPMIVGSNETRHAWMDEGSTTFLEDVSRLEYWPGVDHHRLEEQGYLQTAAAGLEQSLMRHGDWYEPGPGYGIASYSKPATLMVALRDMMGPETWEQAYRAFISEWAYKHPSPWDFFNTFERVAGRDLDWFWTSFYYETWAADYDAAGVTATTGGPTVVRVVNRGLAPFPLTVRITTANGTVLDRTVPVEYWLDGHLEMLFEVPAASGPVTRVEVDPAGLVPDIDRSNNFWPRG